MYYRVIALISADIVPSLDIEGRELASVRRYPNEGQYPPISELSRVRRYPNEGQYPPISVR